MISEGSTADDDEIQDLALARRQTPRVGRAWQDLNLRLMVVGESGTGKSTFINNLFQAYSKKPVMHPRQKGGTSTSASIFRSSPDQLCSYFAVEDEKECIRMHYSIQDTPGYGDSFSPQQRLLDIVEFVRSAQRKYMALEQSFSVDMELDPRVDACLYFVPPHRLKQIDLEFMRQLSRICPLIPIIAKADSMTTDELSSFRAEIKEQTKAWGIELFHFPSSTFDAANIRKEERDKFPPFAIVSSERSASLESGTFWPVRVYQWGTCEAFNRLHSDCSVLKTLLLEYGYHDVKKDSHRFYSKYRTQRMRPGFLASWGRSIDTPFLKMLVAVSPFLHPKMVQCLHTDYASTSLVTTTEIPEAVILSDSGYILPPDPMGNWRHGLCDCSYPVLCLFGCCLPCLPLAQLYEKTVAAGTFVNVLTLFCAMVSVRFVLITVAHSEGDTAFEWIAWFIYIGFELCLLVAAIRIRRSIRQKYNIKETCCGACDDCCCAWCCLPCVITQMWTHVNDPQRTRASILGGFSEVGMPSDFNPKTAWYPNLVGARWPMQRDSSFDEENTPIESTTSTSGVALPNTYKVVGGSVANSKEDAVVHQPKSSGNSSLIALSNGVSSTPDIEIPAMAEETDSAIVATMASLLVQPVTVTVTAAAEDDEDAAMAVLHARAEAL